jgi:hypothetical protein
MTLLSPSQVVVLPSASSTYTPSTYNLSPVPQHLWNTSVVTSTRYSPSLEISSDGEIKFTGKPSKAALALIQVAQGCIDIQAAGKLAMMKSYHRGVKHCLTLAETMTREELIQRLQQELETREENFVKQALIESMETEV